MVTALTPDCNLIFPLSMALNPLYGLTHDQIFPALHCYMHKVSVHYLIVLFFVSLQDDDIVYFNAKDNVSTRFNNLKRTRRFLSRKPCAHLSSYDHALVIFVGYLKQSAMRNISLNDLRCGRQMHGVYVRYITLPIRFLRKVCG